MSRKGGCEECGRAASCPECRDMRYSRAQDSREDGHTCSLRVMPHLRQQFNHIVRLITLIVRVFCQSGLFRDQS